MKYQIHYRQIESSHALSAYIEGKLINALNKLGGFSDTSDVWQIIVEVGRDTMHHRKGEIWFAEVTGQTSYGLLRVRSEASEIYEAIDICEEELKSALSKSKGRILSKSLRVARRVKRMMRLSKLAGFFRKGRIQDEGM